MDNLRRSKRLERLQSRPKGTSGLTPEIEEESKEENSSSLNQESDKTDQMSDSESDSERNKRGNQAGSDSIQDQENDDSETERENEAQVTYLSKAKFASELEKCAPVEWEVDLENPKSDVVYVGYRHFTGNQKLNQVAIDFARKRIRDDVGISDEDCRNVALYLNRNLKLNVIATNKKGKWVQVTDAALDNYVKVFFNELKLGHVRCKKCLKPTKIHEGVQEVTTVYTGVYCMECTKIQIRKLVLTLHPKSKWSFMPPGQAVALLELGQCLGLNVFQFAAACHTDHTVDYQHRANYPILDDEVGTYDTKTRNYSEIRTWEDANKETVFGDIRYGDAVTNAIKTKAAQDTARCSKASRVVREQLQNATQGKRSETEMDLELEEFLAPFKTAVEQRTFSLDNYITKWLPKWKRRAERLATKSTRDIWLKYIRIQPVQTLRPVFEREEDAVLSDAYSETETESDEDEDELACLQTTLETQETSHSVTPSPNNKRPGIHAEDDQSGPDYKKNRRSLDDEFQGEERTVEGEHDEYSGDSEDNGDDDEPRDAYETLESIFAGELKPLVADTPYFNLLKTAYHYSQESQGNAAFQHWKSIMVPGNHQSKDYRYDALFPSFDNPGDMSTCLELAERIFDEIQGTRFRFLQQLRECLDPAKATTSDTEYGNWIRRFATHIAQQNPFRFFDINEVIGNKKSNAFWNFRRDGNHKLHHYQPLVSFWFMSAFLLGHPWVHGYDQNEKYVIHCPKFQKELAENRSFYIRHYIANAEQAALQLEQEGGIVVHEIATCQGRNILSSNGCIMIAAKVASTHLETQGGVTDLQIKNIIDKDCLPLIQGVHQMIHEKTRQSMGDSIAPEDGIQHNMGNIGDPISPDDGIEYMLDIGQLPPYKFVDKLNGNVVESMKLEELCSLLEQNEKSSALFYFKGHAVAILKFPKSETDGVHYDLVESLPMMNGSEKGSRTRCSSLNALKCHLERYTCRRFYEEDLKRIETEEWTESDLLLNPDPRVFEAYVWADKPPPENA